MAMGLKIKKNNKKVVVITGDGEINGSVWEAAMSASMNKLNNLIVMIAIIKFSPRIDYRSY